MKVSLTILALLSAGPSLAADLWAQASPSQRDWMREQRVPGGQITCCTDADFDEVDEDIRGDDYWVRSKSSGGAWVQVPPSAILTGPNKYGVAIVWWGADPLGGRLVRCFAPGART